jgi:hypothetical protein
MDWRQLARLLRQVAETEAEEISCSECFELLSTGVDLELAGVLSEPMWPKLSRHLRQCGVCREEYEVLRDFVSSEPDDLPPEIRGSWPPAG